MKKFKKVFIFSIIGIVLVGIIGLSVYKMLKDENSLTISEKTWISKNHNSVYTIYVPNDINIFGKNGDGVFFDFVTDMHEELDLKLNNTVYSINSKNNTLGFNVDTNYDSRDLLIYTDYYVLASKDKSSIVDLSVINDKNVGIMAKDVNTLSSYYTLSSTFKSYENSDDLFKAFNEELDYIIVPLTQYKDKIVEGKYNICYFFNDSKVYYYLHLGDDKTLNSIITKFYNKWIEDKYTESYNRNNYNLFIKSLGISDIEEDKLTDKVYSFKYLVNQPYSLLSRGEFGGIASQYLKSFEEFSDIDFKYEKIGKYKNLKSDIDKKKVDLFFNQNNLLNSYSSVNLNLNINYYLISDRNVKVNIDSIKAFNGTVFVEENSLLYDYLSNYKNITIKTYSKVSKIKKLIKDGNVVMVDKLSYDSYINDKLSNIHILLDGVVSNKTYTFNYKNSNDSFYKLFSSYVNTLNPKDMVDNSLTEYYKTYEAGSKTVQLAKYIILLIVVLLIGVYILIKSKKRIVLNTKVKKDEKIRYVDMLTSLKNRNYLNDRMEIWNQNTVYPQAVIVLDLNNVKYLNDTFGHEEGDKQIQAAANALFKTQLENTELLRTDGNEFMVYLVGYNEKQVVSYIKKLFKEFKKLPYEYGVAIGFSMINDDLKLIEDAFNEATLMMRENKSAIEGNDDK